MIRATVSSPSCFCWLYRKSSLIKNRPLPAGRRPHHGPKWADRQAPQSGGVRGCPPPTGWGQAGSPEPWTKGMPRPALPPASRSRGRWLQAAHVVTAGRRKASSLPWLWLDGATSCAGPAAGSSGCSGLCPCSKHLGSANCMQAGAVLGRCLLAHVVPAALLGGSPPTCKSGSPAGLGDWQDGGTEASVHRARGGLSPC